MCLSKKTRPIPRLLNERIGDSHYHWTKKWGAGHYVLQIWWLSPFTFPGDAAFHPREAPGSPVAAPVHIPAASAGALRPACDIG
jgi:hypothetical protein